MTEFKEIQVYGSFIILAIFTIILDFITRNPFIHIYIITFIFSIAAIISFLQFKQSKKKHPFFVVYILIFFIWILNLISIEIPKFMIQLRYTIYGI